MALNRILRLIIVEFTNSHQLNNKYMKHFAILYQIEDEKSEEFEKSICSDERVISFYTDDKVDEDGYSGLSYAFTHEI